VIVDRLRLRLHTCESHLYPHDCPTADAALSWPGTRHETVHNTNGPATTTWLFGEHHSRCDLYLLHCAAHCAVGWYRPISANGLSTTAPGSLGATHALSPIAWRMCLRVSRSVVGHELN